MPGVQKLEIKKMSQKQFKIRMYYSVNGQAHISTFDTQNIPGNILNINWNSKKYEFKKIILRAYNICTNRAMMINPTARLDIFYNSETKITDLS